MGALVVSLVTLSRALVGPGFEPIGGRHGVEVYQRSNPAVIELAAVGEFDASPAEAQATLLDAAAHARVIPTLAESTVLERRDGEQWVYQRLKLPIIKDRDYTLRVIWSSGTRRGVRYGVDNTRGPAPTDRSVRLSTLNARWVLEPIRDGRATHATYHIQIDLAGSVPLWMVRSGAARDLPNMFQSMRRLIIERRASEKADAAAAAGDADARAQGTRVGGVAQRGAGLRHADRVADQVGRALRTIVAEGAG